MSIGLGILRRGQTKKYEVIGKKDVHEGRTILGNSDTFNIVVKFLLKD